MRVREELRRRLLEAGEAEERRERTPGLKTLLRKALLEEAN